MAKSEGQRRSKQQEARITKSLQDIKMQARTQMASGAIWFAKSDIVSELFQIEAKTKAKESKSISIKREWLEKIEREGFQARKIPALAFSFGDNVDYFALRDRDFLALVEELLELRKLKEENNL